MADKKKNETTDETTDAPEAEEAAVSEPDAEATVEEPAAETPAEEAPAAEETPAEETPADAPAEEPAAEEPSAAEPEPESAAADEAPTEEEAAPEEPAAEAAAEAADEAGAEAEPVAEEAAPVQQSGPKPKRKRLPRRLRPQKTRPSRPAATGKRKPIVREPKPEHDRGRSQERRGVVVSSAMDKTIVVKVDLIKSHPRYKKVVRRSVKFHAHDEQNAANVGDVVRIVETRPLSKTKRWRLAEVLEVAK